MAYVYAQINKSTLAYIFKGKKVSKEYVVSKTKVKPESLDKWLDVADAVLPTVNQAIPKTMYRRSK